jgi:hypothetical protein
VTWSWREHEYQPTWWGPGERPEEHALVFCWTCGCAYLDACGSGHSVVPVRLTPGRDGFVIAEPAAAGEEAKYDSGISPPGRGA